MDTDKATLIGLVLLFVVLFIFTNYELQLAREKVIVLEGIVEHLESTEQDKT